MNMEPSIQTVGGSYFNFHNPDEAVYTIEDIAHALSHICRFTGHTRRFYSVAQHSVMVSQLVPREHALAGLLHDAAEAFLGDVSSPLKQLLPEYKVIERRVEESILRRFGIPYPLDPCIKEADRIALVTERRDLLPPDPGSKVWAWTNMFQPRRRKVLPLPPAMAKQLFIDRFYILTER